MGLGVTRGAIGTADGDGPRYGKADRGKPPHAVRLTKVLLRESMSTRLDTLLEMPAAFQALSHATADHREAVAAFLEKRAPVFKG